jgi:hypothetical protein
MEYRIHRFEINMNKDQHKLAQFLNSLEGAVAAIIPNVTSSLASTVVDFLLIVEQLS